MNTLTLRPGADAEETFARSKPDYVDARVLAAGTEQTHTKPSGANFCLFSCDGDFYARPDATAAVPGGNVTDGSAAELNPTVWDVHNVTAIHLIAPADQVVTMTFYK